MLELLGVAVLVVNNAHIVMAIGSIHTSLVALGRLEEGVGSSFEVVVTWIYYSGFHRDEV